MSQAERVVLLRQGARLPELDGIRGLAILPVLFLHWIVQPIEPLLRDLSPHLWALANLLHNCRSLSPSEGERAGVRGSLFAPFAMTIPTAC